MDVGAVILGVVGTVGTLSGSLLAPRVAARQARAGLFSQQLVELYRDAMLHAQLAEQLLEHVVDKTAAWHRYAAGGPSPLASPDDVSARMSLLAPTNVAAAWRQMVVDRERLEWHSIEEVGDPEVELDDDNPHVVSLRESVVNLQVVCRREIKS